VIPQLTSWRPLLEGPLAIQARQAVDAILDALLATSRPQDRVLLDIGDPTLFFSYFAECCNSRDLPPVRARLQAALQRAPEGEIPADLYGGIAGCGWVAVRLQQTFGLEGATDAAEVDDALAEYLGQAPETDPYDLISGLVGLGVYALERLPRPQARTCLELILERLTETAERRPEGVTWWTRPELMGQHHRADHPDGYYDLGVAHGIPGVIGLLAGMVAAGVEAARARSLLEAAVHWLLAQDPPDAKGFPFRLDARSGTPSRPQRLAWCYGDAGVAAVLLCAARATGESAWEEAARRIACRGARRPPPDCRIDDSCLCHGAAGLGHLFNRMSQTTGHDELAEAARFWLGQVFALRQPGKRIAGFPYWDRNASGAEAWVESAGFLMGAAGVGLALLAAVSSVEPTWDRLMLVSLPPFSAPRKILHA
jgi:hypothetical protein